jgi:hypothetical protein
LTNKKWVIYQNYHFVVILQQNIGIVKVENNADVQSEEDFIGIKSGEICTSSFSIKKSETEVSPFSDFFCGYLCMRVLAFVNVLLTQENYCTVSCLGNAHNNLVCINRIFVPERITIPSGL